MPWIDKCLGSIDFSKFDVVIVDNASSDETVVHLQQNYPGVKLFEESKNLGFGQANNKGISYALSEGAEHVFLLNQDAYLVDDALEQLVEFQKKNSEFGVLSPIHTNAEVNRLEYGFSTFMGYDSNPDFYSDFVLNNTLKQVYETPFVNAAGWLLSKECLMCVGGFDPIFFHYGEDENYCQRVIFQGFRVGVLPNSIMIHDKEKKLKNKAELFSEKYFIHRERSLKIRFANINSDNYKQLPKRIKKLRRQLLKARLTLNTKAAARLIKMIQLHRRIIPEIQYSISLNKLKKPHYLELKNINGDSSE